MTASAYTQKHRPTLAKLDGKGPYIVTDLTVTEQIFSRSDYAAVLISKDKISESLLGKAIDLSYSPGLEGNRKEARRFHALVSSIESLSFDPAKALYTYRIEAIDPLSVFNYRVSSRTFQDMTSKQIIEKVLSDSGLKSYFKLSMRSAGSKHTYCIQFNENDYDFLRRMMASEGWHYHSDHNGNQPCIIIGDNNQDFANLDNSKIPFITGAKDKTHAIIHWHVRSILGVSKLSLGDHNAELAECLSSGNRTTTNSVKNNALTQYFFGQGHSDKNTIRDSAKRQMESIDTQKINITAQSSIPALGAGLRFTLTDHSDSEHNQEYVVTQAQHHFSATESGHKTEYTNTFQCMPASILWRPPFLPKPQIHSVQSAEVTGPSGEETNQDKQGRIKIHFHWDLQGKKDEKSSCWVPVSQATASNGFGVQFIPRVGDEVLINFIDGDPDRPVVCGSIYTGKNKPPYSTATQSGIKTRSTPKGNASTANELRFEDKKDKEEIFLQAEKDLTINVKQNNKKTVTGTSLLTVEKTINISSKEATNLESKDALSTKSVKDTNIASDANISLDAGKNANISATSAIKIDGQTIELKGKTKIKLSVGGSSIEISPSGIKITGPQIAIEGQGSATLKATIITVESKAKTDIKGALVGINGSAMTQVKAGAMVQIQGAITKVN
ncbi:MULTISPECIES: type VI secretion system Vgr family protein [unclassified Moritella]|uniref:type VI secretion system Vgr family protein n=1 Tax=unclassified Moritella TaxID=2637987 RepID=UPI001BAE51FC|nr:MULTISPECIES: type VI secretion system tip protein TssI/VgrG [unclassified Moritella]QUM84115.1 type VI secretion system tip protein VgrG [Moritella sp. 28]QUM88417.1 type VI secretion system tip protein VgrG [Moritella sp. 36]